MKRFAALVLAAAILTSPVFADSNESRPRVCRPDTAQAEEVARPKAVRKSDDASEEIRPVDDCDPSQEEFLPPLENGWITASYGSYSGHVGTNFSAEEGSAVRASKSGTVSFAGWKKGLGNTVILDHSDGWQSWYSHCSSLSVEEGEHVCQGDELGILGKTGMATGLTCQLFLLHDGEYQNPETLLKLEK